jgi:phosphoribosylformylglycinamidine synthase
MALAGRLGAAVDLGKVVTGGDADPDDSWLLFAESNGRYLVEVAPEHAEAFERAMAGVPWGRIGQVTDEATLTAHSARDGEILFALSVERLTDAWRGHVIEEGA